MCPTILVEGVKELHTVPNTLNLNYSWLFDQTIFFLSYTRNMWKERIPTLCVKYSHQIKNSDKLNQQPISGSSTHLQLTDGPSVSWCWNAWQDLPTFCKHILMWMIYLALFGNFTPDLPRNYFLHYFLSESLHYSLYALYPEEGGVIRE